MNTIGLFYNSNLAVTQFDNFPFRKLCLLGDEAVGANEEGIFKLYSGQTDSETKINSKIVLGPTDFDISNPKRVRVIDIGCKCSGVISATVSDEEGRSFTKTGETNTHLFIPEQIVIHGDRNVRGRFLTFTFENVDGCDFEILQINVGLTIMRPERR